MMTNTNPRDTQFAGFAQLLFDELCSRNDMYIDSTNEYWEEEWKKIIARRAYDLAKHVLREVSYDGETYLDSHIKSISDLTEWPKDGT